MRILLNIVLMVAALALGCVSEQALRAAVHEERQAAAAIDDHGDNGGALREVVALTSAVEDAITASRTPVTHLLRHTSSTSWLDSAKRLRSLLTQLRADHRPAAFTHFHGRNVAAARLGWYWPFRPHDYHVVGLRHIIC